MIAACIPTLRPLFSRGYPPGKKGWSRKLADDRRHSEEKRRLGNFALRTTVPTVPLDLDLFVGESEVAVVAGSTRQGSDVDSPSRDGDSGGGFGRVNEGIVKKAGFSLDSRSYDEAVGWVHGSRGHAELVAFNQV